jgi:hypothetical protein
LKTPYSPAGRIDSQGNIDVTARLEPAWHAVGSYTEGASGWTAPPKPRVTGIANFKTDALGRMYARGTITEQQFHAGRTYQRAYDASVIGSVRSVDLSRTRVSGGLPPEPLTDRQHKAAAKLRHIEVQLQRHYGDFQCSSLWVPK